MATRTDRAHPLPITPAPALLILIVMAVNSPPTLPGIQRVRRQARHPLAASST